MPARPRVVVLGGSFAGAYCAQALQRAARRGRLDLLLIDRNNYFVFYPLLVEAGTGSLEPRHAVVSIRSFLRHAGFRMAEVTGVDLAGRNVSSRVPGEAHDTVTPWDHLVIALGSVTRFPPVPGLREHALEMKSIADAVAMRDRAIALLERASSTADPEHRRTLLRFVVVGANFSGAEVAGELEAFLKSAVRRYPSLDPRECVVTLVERSERILGALPPALAEYATRAMRARGIEVLLRESVVAVGPGHVELASGPRLPAATTIWCAGIAPPPLLASLGLPLDRNGYLVCDPDTRVRGQSNVWGIGDCAVNPDPQGAGYPATAQHAIREGRHAAAGILATLDGRPTAPLTYRTQGSIAALGCRTGVAEILGVRLSGFWAWWLWRTVYLLKMPGLTRRLRIAADWTLDLLFPRDYVQLGMHRPVHAGEPARHPAADPGVVPGGPADVGTQAHPAGTRAVTTAG